MAQKGAGLGLALAGGGFLGAVYELGALAALSEAVEGFDPAKADVYVGVSAGAFVSAALASGLSPHQLVRMFVESEDADHPFDPASMIRPEWSYLEPKSLLRAVRNVANAITASSSPSVRARLWQAADRLVQQFPGHLLDAEPGAQLMRRLFIDRGHGDDFRALKTKLRVVATDFDAGESVEFGAPGFDDVPISQAILASSAIPGLFKPVVIKGRRYVDGALNKTLHASVALQEGASLVVCINPLVPYTAAVSKRTAAKPVVGDQLMPVLGQAIRTAIRSRMSAGMQRYRTTHPNADIVLIEPASNDSLMFNTRIFSFAARRELCEHAYQQTRLYLIAHFERLQPVFARHDMRLRRDVLQSRELSLTRGTPWPRARRRRTLSAVTMKLHNTLDDLQRQVEFSKIALKQSE